jgi:Na+/H+ antiporter NhaD/arsenite permease-like protein
VAESLKDISILWIIPFVGLLLSIAIMPLINENWWHHNFPKVSLLWGVPMAAAMFIILPGRTINTAVEFCSFIALIGSLYVISSGIFLHGSFKSTPLTNCLFLAAGAVLANMIGTAGASMVLVRPMLRINSKRKSKMHIFIFFIFIVSNIGGSLTPLGDPPLFLGFLQGVPFHWTLIHLFPGWAFSVGTLILIFFVIDSVMLKKDGGVEPSAATEKFVLEGKINFLFLLGVLATVILYGNFLPNQWGHFREAIQIALMCIFAVLSYRCTPNQVHMENKFSWFPIKEVAIIFAAIFACMIPALNILEYKGSTGQLAVTHSWQFFWMSGGLSSFLDNAPTYLVFQSLGKTMGAVSNGVCHGVPVFQGCVPIKVLMAISMGAVFMGANTYIGNAPNFMVKSICKENKVAMPSFFGYMAWSLLILEPLFIAVTFIFFRT